MNRIRNTVEIAKASWQVLLSDKELMLLPVMSSVASLIIAATFLVPVAIFTNGEGPVPVIVGVITYLVLAFIVIYFNTALIGAAHQRLTGGDPTLSSALAEANRHLPAILLWAAISGTVSAILKAIEERAGIIGSIAVSLVGLAWTLVTFLVIPIYVIEGLGVVDAIKRSSQLFKGTWGENMAANVGFGIIAFLAILPLVLIAVLGVSSGNGVLAGAGIGVAVVGAVLISIVMATLSGIFQTALFSTPPAARRRRLFPARIWQGLSVRARVDSASSPGSSTSTHEIPKTVDRQPTSVSFANTAPESRRRAMQ